MTPAELDAIVQGHGGIAGSLEVDPYITDETGKVKERNLRPQYKLTFRDGTELTVRPQATWSDDSGEPDISGWDITDAGTAMKAPSQSSAASQWSIQARPDGSKVRVNELTGEVAPLEGFEAKPDKPDTFVDQDPITGARVLRDKSTGTILQGISPSIPGWVPGRGVVAPKEPKEYAPQYPNVITHGTGAYKVDPYTGAVEKVYDFGATPLSEQDLWNQGQDLWQRDYQAQQLEAQKSNWAKQYQNERDKLASQLGEWWSSQRLQAAPYVMNPDWNGTPPGWGANGPVAQLYKMSGSAYTPTVLPQIQFDPQQAWQAAQQATGG